LEESVIVQSTVTLLGMGLIVYMVAASKVIPQEFWTIFGIIIGFWFGSKVQVASKAAAKEEANRLEKAARIVNSKEC
jgi:uncharacterized membrane protein